MKVTSLRYLDAKFHHPSLGASLPNRGKSISCVQNSRKTENRNSVNNSGIGILCSKNSNGRLAFPSSSWASCFIKLNSSKHNQNITQNLTFRPLSEDFIRRSWYSVPPVLDTRGSRRVKKAVMRGSVGSCPHHGSWPAVLPSGCVWPL